MDGIYKSPIYFEVPTVTLTGRDLMSKCLVSCLLDVSTGNFAIVCGHRGCNSRSDYFRGRACIKHAPINKSHNIYRDKRLAIENGRLHSVHKIGYGHAAHSGFFVNPSI